MRQETRSRGMPGDHRRCARGRVACAGTLASRPDVGGVDDGEREGRGSAEAGKREGAIGADSRSLAANSVSTLIPRSFEAYSESGADVLPEQETGGVPSANGGGDCVQFGEGKRDGPGDVLIDNDRIGGSATVSTTILGSLPFRIQSLAFNVDLTVRPAGVSAALGNFRLAASISLVSRPSLCTPLPTMWILLLLTLVFSRLACAVHNYTIDDASPLITYNAPGGLRRNHTAFDSRLLWDGTITYVVPTPNFSPTISIPFNGTAIYIFVAYPGLGQPAPSGFTALIDGVPAAGVPPGGWAALESALLYRHLVYHIAALPAAPHRLVMQIKPGWELYFDSAVYTSDVDPPVAVESATLSSGPGGMQQSPSAVISTLTTLDASGEPIVLTIAGAASTIDNNIISTVTQAAETSIAVSMSWVTQQVSGGATVTSAESTPTLSGTSASNNTNTIIRMTGNPPIVPMIGAFLGGALFATLVMAVCLILLRRRRTRKRKRTAWIFNEPLFGLFDEGGGRGEKGDVREKHRSVTDSDFWGPMSDLELDGTSGK
ncbi:hypothetical protein GGX14DRAFT_596052 [Mycena pura]|uniref:receptor protein-tyrosine kinase n=1 Tax=Mycena pura TaxID=153505 RepID=A0AAD6Y375_9AGAR|nr:hypothetical protein GGX14DRAFT_596052 [Mycena pura]